MLMVNTDYANLGQWRWAGIDNPISALLVRLGISACLASTDVRTVAKRLDIGLGNINLTRSGHDMTTRPTGG
jgi:hypothetical protein